MDDEQRARERDRAEAPDLPASRLRPRRSTAGDPMTDPMTDPYGGAFEDRPPLAPTTEPVERRSPFAPHTFGGGRVRVYGCSPGFLLISLVASVVLTLILNLFLGFLF